MQFKNLALLSAAAMVAADTNCGDGSCTTSTLVFTATTTGVDGIVLTSFSTTTDVGRSTTLVPVLTQSVDTTTDVGTNTLRTTLSQTTDIGTTPTNTQYATTTDINLQSGYAYTTDDSGHTIATYTGTGTAPSLTVVSTTVPVAGATTKVTTTTTPNGAMATAAPFFGAAAIAGLAAFAI